MVDIDRIVSDPSGYANEISVKNLVKLLTVLSKSYYNTGKSLVSDNIYDILREVLKERSPNNPFLKQVGVEISKDKVSLPFTMPSLDKIKPNTGALDSFIKEYKGPYVLSDKLDGVSGLLYKVDEKFKLYTRGDGKEGQDISYLIDYIIPKKELKKIPEKMAIRGELIISKENFKKIPDMANARNTVSGLVNSKTYKKRLHIAKVTDFVAYAILSPRINHVDQMKKLKSLGIKMVFNETRKKITNEYLSELLTMRRTEGSYDIDGIVVVDSSSDYEPTQDNPPHAFAFKQVMTDQVAEVIVKDVLWNPSKDGYLKPRIEIVPVTLVGVTITYTTGFNAKFIFDNKIGPGSRLKIVRSGDVIPHILEVLEPSSNGKPKGPSVPYKWNKTKVDLVIDDIHGKQNEVVIVKRLRHFFKLLKVKYLDEGILTQLVKNGFDTIEKIIQAESDEFAKIPGLGEKMFDKISNEISKGFQNTDMVTLMAASQCFGRGIGRRKIKPILNEYPGILKDKSDVDTLIKKVNSVKGYELKTSRQFVAGLEKFKKFYSSLKEIVDLKHLETISIKKPSKKKLSLVGEKVVFTGFRNKDMEEKVEELGGKVSSSVSSNTTIVVHKDDADMNSAKIKKAQELNIKLIKKSDFEKTLK